MQYENVLYVYERYRDVFYFRDGKLECQHDWYPQILSEVDYDIEKIMLEAGYQSLAKLDSILRSL